MMMTTTSAPPRATRDRAEPATANRAESATPVIDRHRWLPASVMSILVTAGFLIPLLRNPIFYYWDDTVGAAVGVWQRIGGSVLQGQLPFLELDMWRGGNLIGEAATGMWNPIMLGLMVVTHPIDNLALSITIAKWVFFIIEAFGVYLLARNYGAHRWWAALAGTALPIAGWALFIDGTAWINATAGAAFLPWAWWAFRRAYVRGFTPGAISVAVIVGYIHVSTGNPYSVITLAVVGLAVAVEAAWKREWRAILWIVGIGAITALLVVIVFLPFVFASQVGFRADSSTWNDEQLSPNISTLLGLSMPAYKPWIIMFGKPMTIPGVYLAWFFLPLIPWLRWRSTKMQWPAVAGILVFAAFFLVCILGPSQMGMFRWPARLIPFFYLAIMVLFVVVASRGLHRDRVLLRASLTGAALLAGAWMAFSDLPALWKWQAACLVVSAGLLVLAWYWARTEARLYAVLAGGLILFIGAQVMIADGNNNVANYDFLKSRSEMQQRFGESRDGLVVQVTSYGTAKIPETSDGIWQAFMPGNMPSVIGMESTTAYSGIGFNKLDNALCISYNGLMCAGAWDTLWKHPSGFDVPLADIMRVQEVVVQKDYVEGLSAPDGWTQTAATDAAITFRRDAPLAFPGGRVGYVGDAVTVTADQRVGTVDEDITVTTAAGTDHRIVFARLAWPGYIAELNGRKLPISTTSAGLLQVTVPDGAQGTIHLSWTPPGLWIGVGAFMIGIMGWIALVLIARRRRRTTG